MNIEQKFQAPLAIIREIKKNVSWQKYSDLRIKRGHRLFEFCLTDGILQQVNLTKEPGRVVENPHPLIPKDHILIAPHENKTIHYSVKSKPNTIYWSCLNMDSAIKRAQKVFGLTKFTRL